MRLLLCAASLPLFGFISGCATEVVSNQDQQPSKETRDQIRKGVQLKGNDIHACWVEHLRNHPEERGGKLVLSWHIGNDGRAKDLAVAKEKSTLTNRIFQDCMMDQIRDAIFPAPAAGQDQEIVFPFAFKVAEPKAPPPPKPLPQGAPEA